MILTSRCEHKLSRYCDHCLEILVPRRDAPEPEPVTPIERLEAAIRWERRMLQALICDAEACHYGATWKQVRIKSDLIERLGAELAELQRIEAQAA